MVKRTFLFISLLLLPGAGWALRVVSLAPSNTEMVDALGLGDQIVGITIYDEKKPGRTVIGDFLSPSVEMIVSLKPDLILGGNWENVKTVPELRRLGYSVIEVSSFRHITDIYKGLDQIAQALKRPETATPVIQNMKARIAAVQKRSQALPQRYRTYLEIDTDYWTVGGDDFISEAAGLCGADNIFPELKEAAAQVSPEAIIARSPDVIILFSVTARPVENRPGWSKIPAVQRGWVLKNIPANLVHPSPKVVDGMETLVSELEKLKR